MKIMILGASGMLGNAIFRMFSMVPNLNVFGTIRSERLRSLFPATLQDTIISDVNVDNLDVLVKILSDFKPDVIINCIGVVKQLSQANEPLTVIPLNSIFPHRLYRICELSGTRMIHISTDCVFSGSKGMYTELDTADANDLYGRSKLLGEVHYPNSITLRTSIIGHELIGKRSLVDWFLSQNGSVSGFKNALFSGLPTIEIAKLILDYVLPNPMLHGLYHVSSDPISKYDLLTLVADVYNKNIDIQAEYAYKVDRSLDSSRFRLETGFRPKDWRSLIVSMKDFG